MLEQIDNQNGDMKNGTHDNQVVFDDILGSDGENTRFINLDHLDLIGIDGSDAESFLQGQLSNDISKLEQGQSQLHAYCNPKGRILAILRVMRNHDGFWLMIPKDITESLTNRLKIYILRANVKLEVDDRNAVFGIVGNNQQLIDTTLTFNIESAIARRLIITDRHQISEILPAPEHVWDSRFWRLADILSGIPQVYAPTLEVFIPQHVNLDRVNGISFKKGCYPGQEIIARIKYLGKSKQHMIIAKVDSKQRINPGDKIFAVEKPNQKSGLVVDAVLAHTNHYYLSAMISADNAATKGDLRVGAVSGPKMTRLPMTYPLDNNSGYSSKI